jgi:hypothetical protein
LACKGLELDLTNETIAKTVAAVQKAEGTPPPVVSLSLACRLVRDFAFFGV